VKLLIDWFYYVTSDVVISLKMTTLIISSLLTVVLTALSLKHDITRRVQQYSDGQCLGSITLIFS